MVTKMAQSDNSVDVRNPPMDNFNPGIHQMSHIQDGPSNGTTQSYSSYASKMIHGMVRQLQYFVKDNQDLKKSIKLNNQELQLKYQELLKWKNNNAEERQKLLNNFKKAHTVVKNLREQNLLLKTANVKLELRLSTSADDTAFAAQAGDDDVDQGKIETEKLQGSALRSKYLSTVDELELKLKEALTSRDQIDAVYQRVVMANRQLQQQVANNQVKLRDLEIIKSNNKTLDANNQALHGQLKNSKEKCRLLEKAASETKAQLVQLMNCEKAYQKEIDGLKTDRITLQNELRDARNRAYQMQENFMKKEQDYIKLKDDKAQEVKTLSDKVSEKTHSLDELFREYDNVRLENQRLSAKQSDVDGLLAKLISAEESLGRKERETAEMHERFRNDIRNKDDEIRKLAEDTNFFRAQSDVYKQDFLMEREDRAKTHELNEQLKARLDQLMGM